MTRHVGSTYATSSGLSCRAYVSLGSAVDTAAIFVHGFHGDEERTWRKFQSLIDEHPDFGAVDAYFVGYPSTREQIGATASKLTGLIHEVFPRPPDSIFKKLPIFSSAQLSLRKEVTQYQRLVLIGHSQGGVVIRKAVLEEAKEALRDGTAEGSPLCAADLALFAPALFGMFLSGWKGFASATSAWKLVGPILSGSPSFKELQQGSQFLGRLERETEKAAATDPDKVAGLSARILWANRDEIVQGGLRYDCDPPYHFRDKDHVTVCKPLSDYQDPLLFVLGR